MAKVTLRKFNKWFGKVHVVVDLDLDIAEGEFVSILGPSGSGKTTTFNCIAGLEQISSGEIFFDDLPVNDLSPSDRRVAMVFQDYALYPHMSIYENLAFGLKMSRMPQKSIDKRVKEVAEVLEISPWLDQRPAQLSGGQRQRVALGRAIARDVVVYLMDEPLSNLDAALRAKMRTEIKSLHQKLGITTIYVTHDQEEAMVLSNRVAILNWGKLQQFSSPNDIYNDPKNLFVASFVGNPQMNLIKGTLYVKENKLVFSSGSFNWDLGLETLKKRPKEPSGILKDILLGVRPEKIKVNRKKKKTDLNAVVYLVEPVGPVTYVDLDLDGLIIKASTDPEKKFKTGEKVGFTLPHEKLYLFDNKTGLRI